VKGGEDTYSVGPLRKKLISITLFEVNGKAIHITSRAGPWGCETSRVPHFLGSRLTDGGEVVSLTRRPPFTPRNIPRSHFCQRLSRPQGHNAGGMIRSIEKSTEFLGNRTHDLPACGVVPQPTTLPRALSSALMLFSHLRLPIYSGLFLYDFPTKTLYAFLLFSLHATFLASLILLDLITLMVFSEEYMLPSSLLCSLPSSSSYYFIHLRSKYSPQLPLFKHLQSVFFP
jgi:hypothetical protein